MTCVRESHAFENLASTVLFVDCGVGGVPISRRIHPMLPFYAAMIAALMLITSLPEAVIMWLPGKVGKDIARP